MFLNDMFLNDVSFAPLTSLHAAQVMHASLNALWNSGTSRSSVKDVVGKYSWCCKDDHGTSISIHS
jgi:hypothetical protein